MSGWTGAIVGMLVALNPPAINRVVAWLDDPGARRRLHLPLALVLVLLSLLAAPILGLLDVSTHTFRLAAAVVVGITGAKWLLAPTSPITSVADERDGLLHSITLWFAPAPVLMALAANSEAGTVAGLVACAIAAAATVALAAMKPLPDPVAGALVRFVGALGIVAAVAIGLDAARSV